MLRIIALTGPYFHDGTQKTLEQTAKKIAWLQLGKQLTNVEAKEIAAFLNTFTDKGRAKD